MITKIRRRSGRFEKYLRVGNRIYVQYEQDANSNYLAKPSQEWRDINSPLEDIIVRLLFALYDSVNFLCVSERGSYYLNNQ